MKSTHLNEAKASMDHIYDNPDPREYFRELGSHDYTLPGVAKHLFQVLILHLQGSREDAINILDLGCSYGVNAALLKHDLSMTDLFRRWGHDRLEDATSEEVLACDRRFFSRTPEHEDIRVLGLDAGENAVIYAEDAVLLDEGLAVDLESESLPAPGATDLMSVDLVISTGCVGYVTDATIHRLVPAVVQGVPPWFANFALRTFPFEAIARVLADSDYVTEKLERCTLRQRRREEPENHLPGKKELLVHGLAGRRKGRCDCLYPHRNRQDERSRPAGVAHRRAPPNRRASKQPN